MLHCKQLNVITRLNKNTMVNSRFFDRAGRLDGWSEIHSIVIGYMFWSAAIEDKGEVLLDQFSYRQRL